EGYVAGLATGFSLLLDAFQFRWLFVAEAPSTPGRNLILKACSSLLTAESLLAGRSSDCTNSRLEHDLPSERAGLIQRILFQETVGRPCLGKREDPADLHMQLLIAEPAVDVLGGAA